MEEQAALRALKRGDEAGLAWMIDRYAAYVSTIVYHIIGAAMTAADVEEVSSDVFLVLWSNAGKVRPGKVKAYLSGIARNKAKEKLRTAGQCLPLEEDAILIRNADPECDMEAREQAAYIRRATLAMGHPDREIFLRHYYYCQPVSRIAAEMNMNPSTVKTRLRRGRDKLKKCLQKGGYDVAEADI